MNSLMDEDEELNPMLSVANIVDVFLVVIAALLIAIAQNPMNPFGADNVTVIKNAGQPDMEIIIKKGEVIEHFKKSGEIGQGEGFRVGVAYRMEDGTMIYVPESN